MLDMSFTTNRKRREKNNLNSVADPEEAQEVPVRGREVNSLSGSGPSTVLDCRNQEKICQNTKYMPLCPRCRTSHYVLNKKKVILLDFWLTVKATPQECVIRTSQP